MQFSPPHSSAPVPRCLAREGEGAHLHTGDMSWGSSMFWNPQTALHLPQCHRAPGLRSEQHFCQSGDTAFFSPSSLQVQTSKAICWCESQIGSGALPDVLTLWVLSFLLGTFRCSAAVFLLPRKNPNKLACSYLMVIPFAAAFLSRWHHYVLNDWKH